MHINAVATKLSQKLGILKYLKKYVTQSHLIHLYKTPFQPCIDYCITIWGYAAERHLNKVQRILVFLPYLYIVLLTQRLGRKALCCLQVYPV